MLRSLELLLLLDAMWSNTKAGLSVYPLFYLNYSSFNVINFARTMVRQATLLLVTNGNFKVEFMAERIMKSFEAARDIPFTLKNVVVINSIQEVEAVRGPKVCTTAHCITVR